MKYGVTVLLLAVMSAPLSVLAGDDKSPVTDGQLDKMQKRLQLTDEQVAEMRQIRENGGSKKDMRGVLNSEQKAQAKKLKQNRKKQGGAKPKPKPKPESATPSTSSNALVSSRLQEFS